MIPAPSHPSRRATLIADDYGLGEGHDGVMRQLLRDHAIDGVSVLVSDTFTRDRARRLAGAMVRGEQQVGLHFNLTLAMPGVPAMGGIGALVARSALGRLDAEAAAAALRVQFDRFTRAFGRAPDFIDGHQHVHALPALAARLLDETAALMPDGHAWWVRSSAPATRMARMMTLRRAGLKAWPIMRHGLALRDLARDRSIETNDDFGGILRLDRPDFAARGLRAAIDRPRPGIVVMCHPGSPTDSAAVPGHPNRCRDAEAQVLTAVAMG